MPPSPPRLRILHAIHDFLPRHRAGSEIHLARLAKGQSERHEVFVLCAEYSPEEPHGRLDWRDHDGIPVVEIGNAWAFDGFEESQASPLLSRRLATILETLRPDVVHVHSLTNLGLDLPALARRSGAAVVATLHDFSLACAAGGQRIHFGDGATCDEIDPARCATCFPASPLGAQLAFGRLALRSPLRRSAARLARRARSRAPRLFRGLEAIVRRLPSGPGGGDPGAFARRIERARRAFDLFDVAVAPSAPLAADFRRFGFPAERIEVSDYGFPPLPASPPRSPCDRLRIGFVGTLVRHKGAHLLLSELARLPAGRWEATIFGDPATFPAYAAELGRLAAGIPVRFDGPFDPPRAGAVYSSFDLLVVPSLWPENSPLVIHEAFQAGVPVVGSRRGGIPELLGEGRAGLLFDPERPGDLADAIARLLDEPGLLDRLRGGIPAVKTLDAELAEWDERYRRAVERFRAEGIPA